MTRNEKTVVLEVAFSIRQPVQPILDRLLESGLRAATVLRGRVTDFDAWYQLELRGNVRIVDAVVEDHRHDGLCFPRLVPIHA